MNKAFDNASSSRTGAALVVALGVLSLVLLLATAFVLSMQTERLAFRNASEKTDARAYADIGVLTAAAYMEPETNEPNVFLTPHAYWLDDSGASSNERENVNEALRRVYEGHSLLERTAEIQGLLVGSDGTEIGGQEIRIGGPDALFSDFPPVVTNYLPPLLVHQLSTNALPVRWQYITSVNQNDTNDLRVTGRVTFFMADISGLADIRHATSNQLAMAGITEESGGSGAKPPSFATAVTPVDLAAMLAAASEGAGDSGAAPVWLDTFTTFSLDPDPWRLPIGTASEVNMFIGHALAPSSLTNKFDLAALTNGSDLVCEAVPSLDRPGLWRDAAADSSDLRVALDAVSNALFRVEPFFGRDTSASNSTARAVFWNLLNDIDADRYPQTDTDEPWLDDFGVEALPLVSEFDIVANSAEDSVLEGLDDLYASHCPACEALREANAATNLAHRVSSELWYPFASTNELPDETHVALHLWKTTYTNDVHSAFDRMTNNLASVTETLVAHWGTNVYSRSYRVPRGSRLEFPETATHTLQYGVNDAMGAYMVAGVLPEDDSGGFVPDLVVTADVTLGMDTNSSALTATSTSTNEPLHLFDVLLEGPLSSLLAGTWSLDYTTTTNTAAEEPDDPWSHDYTEPEEPVEPIIEYTTTFTFFPDDPDLLADLLAAFAEEPAEEAEEPPEGDGGSVPAEEPPEGDEGSGADDSPSSTSLPPSERGDAPEGQGGVEDSGAEPPVVVPASSDPSAEDPSSDGSEEEPADEPSEGNGGLGSDPADEPSEGNEGSGAEPPVDDPASPDFPSLPTLTIPVTFRATTNDFGETTAVLATTPDSDAIRDLEPFIPRLLRSGEATVTSVTNEPSASGQTNSVSYTRYELSVWYEVVRSGPDSVRGSGGLLESTGAQMLSDASCVLDLLREDFYDGFACVTNAPFYFEAACVHTAKTNGVVIAEHTVTNLLPIGLAAVTNVVYEQKPDSPAIYEAGDAFDWAAVATDFTATNLVSEILNSVHFSAQLYLGDDDPEDGDGRPYSANVVPYDEAPGPGSEAARWAAAASASGSGAAPGGAGAEPPSVWSSVSAPWLLETPMLLSLAVDDPRFNGHTYEWYDVEVSTPGEPPDRFPEGDESEDFFAMHPRFAGYPILHHDGLPGAVGDIGLLGIDEPWETLDLFSASGAKLLDLWCLNAPATNEDRRAFGRIHACTPFPDAAALLFSDTLFGTNRLALLGNSAALPPSLRGDAPEGQGGVGDAGDAPPSLADVFTGSGSVPSSATEALKLLTNAICSVGWSFSPQPTNSFATTGRSGATLPSSFGDASSSTFLPPSQRGDAPEGQGGVADAAIFPFAQWMDALAPYLTDLPEILALPTASGNEGAEPPDFAGVQHMGLDFAEDFIRDLPDRVTFRQNLALAVIRSDSLAPTGRITATAWFVALLYRDAWTGRWFVVFSQELR